MDGYSRETLRMIEENNDTLTELGICNRDNIVSRDVGRFLHQVTEVIILHSVVTSEGILNCKHYMSNFKVLDYLQQAAHSLKV